MNLPPLPEPDFAAPTLYHYTADQLRAYAAEAVRVALEDAMRVCEELDMPADSPWQPSWDMGTLDCAAAIRKMLKDRT